MQPVSIYLIALGPLQLPLPLLYGAEGLQDETRASSAAFVGGGGAAFGVSAGCAERARGA